MPKLEFQKESVIYPRPVFNPIADLARCRDALDEIALSAIHRPAAEIAELARRTLAELTGRPGP